MTQNDRQTLMEVRVCFDLFVCAGSLLLASALLHGSIWGRQTLLLEHPLRQLSFTAVLGLLWYLSLAHSGWYRPNQSPRALQQTGTLFYGVTAASAWTFLWLCFERPGAARFLHARVVEVAIFWIFAFAGLLLTRMVGRLLSFALRRRRQNRRSVLLIGSNRRAVALAHRMTHDPDLGYRLIGFVDDAWHCEEAPERYRRMLIGRTETMLELLRTLTVDEVVLTLPLASRYQFSQQVMEC